MSDEKVPTADPITEQYKRLLQSRNNRRVVELLQTRRKINITTGGLLLFVVGVYTYTITAIKQEKFLDDFEEPKVVPRASTQ